MYDNFSVEVMIRLLAASLLGGIIGLEREIHGRPAGLRTHLLVCIGAAAFMMLSSFIASQGGKVVGDPGRIAAGIVTGIGFLGAGAILKEGLLVRGLTTAACLWVVAAIGMMAGAGFYVPAATTTLVAIFSLVWLPRFEAIFKKHSYRRLSVRTSTDIDATKIIAAIAGEDVKVLRCSFDQNYDTGIATTSLQIRIYQKGVTDRLSHRIVKALVDADIPLKGVAWSH